MEEKDMNSIVTEEENRREENTKEEVSGNGESAEKRKHGKALFIILALAAAAALFIQGSHLLKLPLPGCLSESEGLSPRPKNTMTVAILKEKILEQQKLVTYTDTLEVSIESALSKLNIPFTDTAVPGTKRQFRLTVPVTVDLTTDLQNMEVSYDEENDAASVTIPEAEIFRITPDVSNMRDAQEIGFFRNKMTAEEQQAMLIEAERSARAQIYERNYISFANQRARDLLEEMRKRFGVKYVEVKVR